MAVQTLTADSAEVAASQDTARADRIEKARAGRYDTWLYLGLAALVGVAWWISRLGLFDSGDDFSYWIAVAGGVMMLMLFTYPLRKYVGFMRGLGKVKFWFWLHLCLGIVGPWLILVHSTFHVGSLNAGVALYSMCIVVASGVVGRFIYVRVHRGLNGELTSLGELRARAGLVESEARSKLHFAPAVEQALRAFEERELQAAPGWATYLRQACVLPVTQRITYWRCVAEVRRRLHATARDKGWPDDVLERRERRSRKLVQRYLDAVVRVAQYTAFERIFALWHVAHLPFVYLLVISAVVHVIAVHAY